jgi:catechol 2,3-dioxygenase-like lactoylglutathione lyase family enzyme
MPEFSISHLDHVAIFAADPAASVKWYEEVLGLHKVQLKEWGEFPIFMLAGQVGVAIFKASTETRSQDTRHGGVGIDHFAFNLTTGNFALARAHYETLGLSFHLQDHHYFHSLYTKDPDGNTVELTAAVKAM